MYVEALEEQHNQIYKKRSSIINIAERAVAVDGVIRVGGNKHNGHFQNWIDIYDVTDPTEPNSNKAVHNICTKMVHTQLE